MKNNNSCYTSPTLSHDSLRSTLYALRFMEQGLPLADAYQRLLDEVCRRLGADHADLLLRIAPDEPARTVASSGAAPQEEDAANWLELPINEGAI
ncbi:MAG TPA: hypothetical protein VFX76_05050, partial [Roseiflexaceae bacterium]|nr:hypothetical protein [Roseiflexaceae bacterium]